MADRLRISVKAANAEADALGSLLNSGFLRMYNGIQPDSCEENIVSQKLLAELRFGNPAFESAVEGTIVANSLVKDINAKGTGKVTWFRAFESDGTSVVLDGSVGTSGNNLNLNSVSIQEHAEVSVDMFKHTVRRG